MTRLRYDQFSKGLLERFLSPLGDVELSVELPSEVANIDVGFRPFPPASPSEFTQRLGLLGRMVLRGPCYIEPFSTPPDAARLDRVISKQGRILELAQRDQRREPMVFSPPTLLVVVPTLSESLLGRWRAFSQPDWPEGVWWIPPGMTAVIVVHALPPTPDTLSLRLLGRSQVLRRAIDEVMALPPGDWFRAAAIAQLVRWRTLTEGEDAKMTQEEQELREANERVFQEFCHSLRVEGLREGKSEGLRVAVRNLCEVLDIPVTVEREQIIASLYPEALEALLLQIKRDRRW